MTDIFLILILCSMSILLYIIFQKIFNFSLKDFSNRKEHLAKTFAYSNLPVKIIAEYDYYKIVLNENDVMWAVDNEFIKEIDGQTYAFIPIGDIWE